MTSTIFLLIGTDTEKDLLPDALKESTDTIIKTEPFENSQNQIPLNENDNYENSESSLAPKDSVEIDSITENEQISDILNRLSKINLQEPFEQQNLKLVKGQLVTFKLHDVPYLVEIISRAGKAKGQYKNCFNVKYKEPLEYETTHGHVDFDKVHDIKVIDNTEQVLIIKDENFESAK